MNTNNLNKISDNYDAQEEANKASRLSSQSSVQMPVKADKVKKSKDAFRTISEVADKLDVQQHVLRFWETKFSQIRPLKRGGGRRYYRPEDVALLETIHHLLYTQGYTIKGVQKLLKEQGKAGVIAEQAQAGNISVQPKAQVQEKATAQNAAPLVKPEKPSISDHQRAVLEIMLTELKAMRAMIKV